MAYNHRTEKDVEIIELEEPVDLYFVPELKEVCRNLIRNGSKKIVIDMANLNFMDSSALGLLINLAAEFKQANVITKLANANKGIDHLFSLSKMYNHYGIYNSIDLAISSFL